MDRARKTRLTVMVAITLAIVAVMMLWTTACSNDTTNAAGPADTYAFDCTWSSVNGANNNLPGASTLWILSGGGQGSYTGASLHVVYSNGSTADITGDIEGNGGSVHFTVPGVSGATVTSAVAHYNATQEQTNCVVTISHVIEQGTTTTLAEETTTSLEQTTTTSQEETTTTEAQTTTTVGEVSSTTTTEAETTTTEAQTTTTVGEVSSTTTTEAQTTTTVGEVSSTTTTGGNLTTVTGIQTGGGGTAGPGAGVWIIGLFAIALAGGLGWTAVRSMRK